MGGTPHWSRAKARGVRSNREELLPTHHNPPPLMHRLGSQGLGKGGGKVRNEGLKLNLGKGGGREGVLVFIFVSHHPTLLIDNKVNFPQVKSVLPLTVTGK